MRCSGMMSMMTEDFIIFDTETIEFTPVNNPFTNVP